jgi:uncharacterized membrane protein YgaE (UPF0421/DUF939 family)
MRNIKTAISVLICIAISKVFNNTIPFYACIASVITMQSAVHHSFTIGKNRMFGTIIGALCGLIFTLISPNNMFLTSIGIVLIIYFLNIFERKNSISIACIVFLAIMLNLNEGSPLLYSFNRVIETFVGIVVSVLVNYLIFYPNYLEDLQKDAKILVSNIFSISKDISNYNTEINISNLNAQISKLEKSLDSYLNEIQKKDMQDKDILKINKILESSRTAYNHLTILSSLLLNHCEFNCYLSKNNCDRIKVLFDYSLHYLPYNNNDINIVFNYHLENLITTLSILKEMYKK